MIISIIIPVYNKEKYLKKCLKSLIKQDLVSDEYEIICIDDGSTDGSLNILNDYANKYNNITVISQDNHGVSAARNVGIKKASGDYITFVDPDDFIEENCLGYFGDLLVKNKPQILNTGYSIIKENEKYDTADLQIQISVDAVCGHFYKRDIIISKNIFFDEQIHYAEDAFYNLTYNLYVNKKMQTNTRLYYYVKNSSSVLHDQSLNAHLKRTNSYLRCTKLIKSIFDNYNDNYIGNRNDVFFWMITAYRYSIKHIIFLSFPMITKYIKELKSIGMYPYNIPDNIVRDTDKEWRYLGPKSFQNKLIFISYKRRALWLLLLLQIPNKFKKEIKKFLKK